MIGSAVSALVGGLFSLVLMLVSLLPVVNFETLPLAPPSAVTGILGFLNVFIPIGDLLTIMAVWITLVAILNVVEIVASVASKVK